MADATRFGFLLPDEMDIELEQLMLNLRIEYGLRTSKTEMMLIALEMMFERKVSEIRDKVAVR